MFNHIKKGRGIRNHGRYVLSSSEKLLLALILIIAVMAISGYALEKSKGDGLGPTVDYIDRYRCIRYYPMCVA